MFAPIAIFTYNRLDHFQQTIQHLLLNKEAKDTDLYVFSDAAKHEKDKEIVDNIRDYIQQIVGFRRVFLSSNEENMGLKASIKRGVTEVLSTHDAIIVVEDDICVNRHFLSFHNACLEKYKTYKQLWSVSAFVIPEIGKDIAEKTAQSYFLTQRASSWGWSTWKDRWEAVVWDEKQLLTYLSKDGNYSKYYNTGGDKIRMLLDCFQKKNNSWAIIWDFNHFMQGTYCLYPSVSLVKNIGLDYSGVHSKPRTEYDVALKNWDFKPTELPENPISPLYAQEKFKRLNRKFYRDILDLWRYRQMKINS